MTFLKGSHSLVLRPTLIYYGLASASAETFVKVPADMGFERKIFMQNGRHHPYFQQVSFTQLLKSLTVFLSLGWNICGAQGVLHSVLSYFRFPSDKDPNN